MDGIKIQDRGFRENLVGAAACLPRTVQLDAESSCPACCGPRECSRNMLRSIHYSALRTAGRMSISASAHHAPNSTPRPAGTQRRANACPELLLD
ncbi:hypothetical protein Mapa_001873 [Marchantia paleacea]|nr:hypothetical protein Mapa_001873 [Marchantia paleacea]